jgi:hypothetical protein
MSSEASVLVAFQLTISDAFGADIGRARILDAGISWVVEFGVEGPQVGLYSVTVDKYRTEDLNVLGLLEVALGQLNLKFKESDYAGKRLESRAIEGP